MSILGLLMKILNLYRLAVFCTLTFSIGGNLKQLKLFYSTANTLRGRTRLARTTQATKRSNTCLLVGTSLPPKQLETVTAQLARSYIGMGT